MRKQLPGRVGEASGPYKEIASVPTPPEMFWYFLCLNNCVLRGSRKLFFDRKNIVF